MVGHMCYKKMCLVVGMTSVCVFHVMSCYFRLSVLTVETVNNKNNSAAVGGAPTTPASLMRILGFSNLRSTSPNVRLVEGKNAGQVTTLLKGKREFILFPPEKNITFLEAIKTCETFQCLREAHMLPRGNATFNYPHFMIAGYSKSATTSLHGYLSRHPNVLTPLKKEPALLTNRCKYFGKKMWCPPARAQEYIVKLLRRDRFVMNKGQLMAYEATPRIFDLGPDLADILYDTMPWIKLVVSMREPISRSISKYVMFKEKFNKGCFVNNTLSECLLKDKERFYGNPKRKYYSLPLGYWMDYFPADQIKLIQYEDLIGERQAQELHGLKEFLGIDPKISGDSLDWGLPPTDEATYNCRHCRIHPEGWPIEKTVYRKLIGRVEQDVDELTRLITKFKLGNATRWKENWRRVWDSNLESCDDSGMCHIQLS